MVKCDPFQFTNTSNPHSQPYKCIGIATSCPTHVTFWPILALRMCSQPKCARAVPWPWGQAGEGQTQMKVPGIPLVRHKLPRLVKLPGFFPALPLPLSLLSKIETHKKLDKQHRKAENTCDSLMAVRKKTCQCLYL